MFSLCVCNEFFVGQVLWPTVSLFSSDIRVASVIFTDGSALGCTTTLTSPSSSETKPQGYHNVFTHCSEDQNSEVCRITTTKTTLARCPNKLGKLAHESSPPIPFGEKATAELKILTEFGKMIQETMTGRKEKMRRKQLVCGGFCFLPENESIYTIHRTVSGSRVDA